MSGEDRLRVTYALLRPETALAAVQALSGNLDRAALEGLVELIYHPRTTREAIAAIGALEATGNAIVLDALHAALGSPHPSVRLAAVQDLRRHQATGISSSLGRVLCGDESWPVRRTALHLLATEPGPERWRVLDAATDPHWRVRHALIRVLLRWGGSEADRQEIDRRLTPLGTDARVRGAHGYLHYRWTGGPMESAPSLAGRDSSQTCSFWDWDTAVLLRNLERMGERGRRQSLDRMPFLLKHTDERIRALAGKSLRAWGGTQPLGAGRRAPRRTAPGRVWRGR